MGDAPVPSPRSEFDRLPPMSRYVFGLFRRAPRPPSLVPGEGDALQEAHLAHLRHLRESGELLVVGPLEEDTELRGIMIFRSDSIAQVRELMDPDPLLRKGALLLELYTLFAPAGIRVGGDAPVTPVLDFATD